MRSSTTPLQSLCAAPRAHLFTSTLPRSRSHLARNVRHLSTFPRLKKDDSASPFGFQGMPSPPRLPKEEQEIFESLQRQSTGAFSTPLPQRTPPQINQSPDSSPSEVADAQSVIEERVDKIVASVANEGEPSEQPSKVKELYDKVIEARGKGEELHPDVVRGARPEFEGDVNPKTGEVGGPRNEPLRWGRVGSGHTTGGLQTSEIKAGMERVR